MITQCLNNDKPLFKSEADGLNRHSDRLRDKKTNNLNLRDQRNVQYKQKLNQIFTQRSTIVQCQQLRCLKPIQNRYR